MFTLVIDDKYSFVSFNLDSWGKSKDTNILYITGLSGSGKSTLSLDLCPDNQIIHLDHYTEYHLFPYRNKLFNNYLNKHCANWMKIPNATDKFRFSDNYFKLVDSFRNCIVGFSNEQYLQYGNKIIVEGIQIADRWLSYDYDFYLDKPVIVMTTTIEDSMKYAAMRDDIKLADMKKNRMETYKAMQSNLDNFIKFLSEHS
jgi:uridine kinase